MSRYTRPDLPSWSPEGTKPSHATANIESARRLADNTVKRFPDYAHAHFTRGVVLSIAGEPNGAIGEMTETVRLDPTFGKAFQLRADLYAERKECAPAMADLARAKELLPRLNPAVEQKVRRCR